MCGGLCRAVVADRSGCGNDTPVSSSGMTSARQVSMITEQAGRSRPEEDVPAPGGRHSRAFGEDTQCTAQFRAQMEKPTAVLPAPVGVQPEDLNGQPARPAPTLQHPTTRNARTERKPRTRQRQALCRERVASKQTVAAVREPLTRAATAAAPLVRCSDPAVVTATEQLLNALSDAEDTVRMEAALATFGRAVNAATAPPLSWWARRRAARRPDAVFVGAEACERALDRCACVARTVPCVRAGGWATDAGRTVVVAFQWAGNPGPRTACRRAPGRHRGW